MGESHDFMSLDWVQKDIEQCLRQAQERFEAYLADEKDSSELESCLETVNQVRGSLRMTGIESAADLAEQITALLQALIDGSLPDVGAAHEALAQAFTYLPPYLTRIRKDNRESPILLLAPLNDLRRALGLEPVPEIKFFKPRLQARPPAAPETLALFEQEGLPNIGKFRQIYQFALIGLLRNTDIKVNLGRMANTMARLQQVCKGAPISQLWEIAAAFTEGLLDESIVQGRESLELLRKVDGAIKLLIDQATAGLNQAADETLLNSLLFHIAGSHSGSPRIKAVQQEYALALPSRSDTGLLAGPDRETVNAVVGALTAELSRIKDTIDLYVRNEGKSNIDLGGLLPGLKQLASTLVLLNMESPRMVVQEQIDLLTQLTSARKEVPDETLLSIAEALLFVEVELNSVLETVNATERDGVAVHANAASDLVIAESLKNLKQIQEAVTKFLYSDGNFDHLEQVPAILRGIYGGLAMISFTTAAQLVFSAGQYVEDDILAQQRVPDSEALEKLAEVISTIEFYLDGIAAGLAPNQTVLESAKATIAALGYPIEQTAGISSEREDSFGYELDLAQENSVPLEAETDFVLELEWTAQEPEAIAPEAASDAAPSVEAEEEPQAQAPVFELDSVAFDELDLDAPDSEPLAEQEQAGLDVASEEFALPDTQDWAPAVTEFENLEASGVFDLDETPATPFESEAETLASEPFAQTEIESSQTEVESPLSQVESPQSQADDESLVDDEIFEIFLEEAEEVIGTINENWPLYAVNPQEHQALIETRRGFHTLKGSGRMVGASTIAELAWSVENLLNQAIEGNLVLSPAACGLIDEVRGALPALVEHLKQHSVPTQEVDAWMQQANALATGAELPASASGAPAVEVEDSNMQLGETDVFADAEEELVLTAAALPRDDEDAPPAFDAEAMQVEDLCFEDLPEAQYSLYQIFINEAQQHLATIRDFAAVGSERTVSDEVYRAFHTLKGSARMSELDSIATLAAAMETLVQQLREHAVAVQPSILELFSRSCVLIGDALAVLEMEGSAEIDASDSAVFLDEVARVQTQYAQAAQAEVKSLGALAAFLRDQSAAIQDLADSFEQWLAEPRTDNEAFVVLVAQVFALQTAAETQALGDLDHLIATLGKAYALAQSDEHRLSADCLDALQATHQALLDAVDHSLAGQDVVLDAAVASALDQALEAMVVAQSQAAQKGLASEQSDLDAEDHAVTAEVAQEASPAGVTEQVAQLPEQADIEAAPAIAAEDIDPGLLEIFLEEADEIYETVAQAKQQWIDNNNDAQAIAELQRALHTLKGGARMAGIQPVGDLSHELESIYEHAVAGSVQASPELFDLIHECDDRLQDMLAELKATGSCNAAAALLRKVKNFHAVQLGEALPLPLFAEEAVAVSADTIAPSFEIFLARADNLIGQLAALVRNASAKEADHGSAYTSLSAVLTALKIDAYEAGVHQLGDLGQIFEEVVLNIEPGDLALEEVQADLREWIERFRLSLQEARAEAGEPMVESVVTGGGEQPQAQTKTQETVRVSSGLLEQLVNLAGETSVLRARVEQQVSNFSYAIEEIGVTVERLREQLRRMENETEAQVLFRQEQEGPEHQGFDPLEMDRYSRMQELSRALVESVSDLFDLKDTLRDRTRYTETLLLQQSRINTELQEGMMKTRMVPFARMVPRLRKIVRQISGEVGKRVNFILKNADAELDRSLLEHMTAPLEHMLRNAVDHGVETPAERRTAGKAEEGTVQLTIGRDGADVVLELSDDGAGIDIARVRHKAIERGLMAADAQLGDKEVLQFILQSGFSTAKQVTQISGRGVGMDVVHSEIKQLGGAIQIESVPGKGTRFVVRLPFTVSVNHALMVNIGDDSYALPLGTIEGVVRVSPYELEEYYKPNGPEFEYAGQKYELRYLGDFVNHKRNPQIQNQAMPLPVILVRTAEAATAIQVDSISGSREIVVKPLGPQLGTLPGMSGATILGDGRVVLILDLAAMIRYRIAMPEHAQAPATDANRAALTVMVVDDSVTVRKVASRLLERQGMEVVVAKDGVEAMTKLQEVLPDIMLLDIEMPRMDGFELASLIRHDERLKDMPIVMITSRTGDKHRNRALEIGVDKFMGKPFQEDDLLDAIAEFTRFERKQVQSG